MRNSMAGQTALLVIDVQVAMFEEGEPPHKGEEMLANIGGLLERARAAGAPVIFVRHADEWMAPGTPGFEIHPNIPPRADEVVIDKRACDAFCETPLGGLLESLDVTRVVIAGMQTDYCVDSASRSALHRGYDVLLAKDAHSTVGNGILTAEQIIAHHNQTLANLPRPGFGIRAVPSAEIDFAPAAAAV
jgi:nicotinamidase-related amidase